MADLHIDSRTDAHTGQVVYRLWQRMGDGAEDLLVGEFAARQDAEKALEAALAEPELEPRTGLGTTDSEPAAYDEEDYPLGG